MHLASGAVSFSAGLEGLLKSQHHYLGSACEVKRNMSEKHTRGINFVQGVCPLPPGTSSRLTATLLERRGITAPGREPVAFKDAFSTLTEQMNHMPGSQEKTRRKN